MLGFGKRLTFWLSGCPFRCFGCIEEPLQSGTLGDELSVEQIHTLIKANLEKIDGIGFSGGEPLAQASELLTLLSMLPCELDTILFTGYQFFELNLTQKACYEQFDLIVEGRFEFAKRGNFLWRGSSNQRIISPTHKYDALIETMMNHPSVGLEVRGVEQTLFFYGIPTQNDEIAQIKSNLSPFIQTEENQPIEPFGKNNKTDMLRFSKSTLFYDF